MTQRYEHRMEWIHGGATYEAILHLQAHGLEAITLLASEGGGGLARRRSSLLFAFHSIPAQRLSITEAPDAARLVFKPQVNAVKAFIGKFAPGMREGIWLFTVPLGAELHNRLKETYKIPVEVYDVHGRLRETMLDA